MAKRHDDYEDEVVTQAPPPPPDNRTLGQKLRDKVNEVLDSEQDLNPVAAERANQIMNDAIAGMPPEKIAPTNPETTMAQQTKAKLDAAVASGSITPELAGKLEGLLSDIEAAYKPKEKA